MAKLYVMNSFLPNIIDNHQQQTKGIQTLLHKKMDRREFLLYVGTLFLLITGITGMIKAFHDSISPHKGSTQATQFGFGPYGGHNKEAS